MCMLGGFLFWLPPQPPLAVWKLKYELWVILLSNFLPLPIFANLPLVMDHLKVQMVMKSLVTPEKINVWGAPYQVPDFMCEYSFNCEEQLKKGIISIVCSVLFTLFSLKFFRMSSKYVYEYIKNKKGCKKLNIFLIL